MNMKQTPYFEDVGKMLRAGINDASIAAYSDAVELTLRKVDEAYASLDALPTNMWDIVVEAGDMAHDLAGVSCQVPENVPIRQRFGAARRTSRYNTVLTMARARRDMLEPEKHQAILDLCTTSLI